MVIQLLIGEGLGITGIPFPDQGCLVFPPGRKVSVQAVVAHIELATDEPLVLTFREVLDQDLVPLLKPIQLFCHLCPESFRVVNRPLVNFFVFIHAPDIGVFRQFIWWINSPFLCHH